MATYRFKLRLTENEKINRLSVLAFFSTQETRKNKCVYKSYFCVREIGTETEKPHYQAYIETTMCVATFRAHLINFFKGINGNGDYSLSQCLEPERYCRYLCKGTSEEIGPDLVCIYELKIDAIEEHKIFWIENKKLKSKNPRKSKNMFMKIISEYKEKGYEHVNDIEHLILFILDYYIENQISTPPENVMGNIVRNIILHIGTPTLKLQMRRKYISDIRDRINF